MITRLTGDIGQDMFRIVTASIWAWDRDQTMVFEGDTPYNESLYRNLTFTELLDDPQILPDSAPLLADYMRYKDRIRSLFSIHSDTIEKVVEYAITLPEESITVISTVPAFIYRKYYKEAMTGIGSGIFVATVPDILEDVYQNPLTDPEQVLTLMIGADNLIISDDPLSWWGAFLNCREDARIICPSCIWKKMICDNWIVL